MAQFQMPYDRFKSLEFGDRMNAIEAWQRAMSDRAKAKRYRDVAFAFETKGYWRTAMIAIQNVKYFARKAASNG